MLCRLTALLACSADGSSLPAYIIVKCTVKSADLSSTKVVTKLASQAPFDTWLLRTWKRTISLRGKGNKTETKAYVCQCAPAFLYTAVFCGALMRVTLHAGAAVSTVTRRSRRHLSAPSMERRCRYESVCTCSLVLWLSCSH